MKRGEPPSRSPAHLSSAAWATPDARDVGRAARSLRVLEVGGTPVAEPPVAPRRVASGRAHRRSADPPRTPQEVPLWPRPRRHHPPRPRDHADRHARPDPAAARRAGPRTLPHQRRRRTRRILAQEGVFDAIVSLAGLLGRPVRNQQGQEIGRLEDIVARWADGQVYPPVSGLIIRVGRRIRLRPRVGHRPHRPRRGAAALLASGPARRRPAPGRGAARHATCSTTSSSTSKASRSSAPPTSTWPRCSAASAWWVRTSRPPRCSGASARAAGVRVHPRSRHRLGRHPALQRAVRRAGRRGRAGGAQDDQRGAAPAAPR